MHRFPLRSLVTLTLCSSCSSHTTLATHDTSARQIETTQDAAFVPTPPPPPFTHTTREIAVAATLGDLVAIDTHSNTHSLLWHTHSNTDVIAETEVHEETLAPAVERMQWSDPSAQWIGAHVDDQHTLWMALRDTPDALSRRSHQVFLVREGRLNERVRLAQLAADDAGEPLQWSTRMQDPKRNVVAWQAVTYASSTATPLKQQNTWDGVTLNDSDEPYRFDRSLGPRLPIPVTYALAQSPSHDVVLRERNHTLHIHSFGPQGELEWTHEASPLSSMHDAAVATQDDQTLWVAAQPAGSNTQLHVTRFNLAHGEIQQSWDLDPRGEVQTVPMLAVCGTRVWLVARVALPNAHSQWIAFALENGQWTDPQSLWEHAITSSSPWPVFTRCIQGEFSVAMHVRETSPRVVISSLHFRE